MSLPEIQFYNTLSAKKERFIPKTIGIANIYSCGPTVYSYTHVGNARAAITADFIVRVFKLAGYKTRFISNITDVDDKIIKAANESGVDSKTLAQKFESYYLSEVKTLGIQNPDLRPRATEHIEQIIEMVLKLIEKGKAYATETPFGKDVYFRIHEFKDYGKLSKRNTDDMIAGARVEPGETKENPLDFALWKAAKPGEPSWESPWGLGRPGWHIECSAMVQQHFKKDLDIHMGGLDLIFPHHENEIAQSECFNDHVYAPYWIHNGMLTIEREKMSKSLGNTFLTKDFLEKYGPETLRLLLLQHHYRSPIDFSDESILRTEALVERIYLSKKTIKEKGATALAASTLRNEIQDALFDDFNSAKALGFLLKALRKAFKDNQKEDWDNYASGLELFIEIFEVGSRDANEALEQMKDLRFKRSGKSNDYCRSVEERLEKRSQLRNEKKFAESDVIRAELESEGVIIMDSADGTAWRL